MKKTIFTLALVTTFLAAALFTGCQSSDGKVEAAKADVKDAKQDLKEVRQDAGAEKQKADHAAEWKEFKAQSEAQIAANETRIDELREKMKTSGKNMDALYAKKIDALEEKSKDLKARIANYDYEKEQSNWDNFKREFNHDMNELGQAFKDLGVDNKN